MTQPDLQRGEDLLRHCVHQLGDQAPERVHADGGRIAQAEIAEQAAQSKKQQKIAYVPNKTAGVRPSGRIFRKSGSADIADHPGDCVRLSEAPNCTPSTSGDWYGRTMTPPNVREWRDGGRWLPTAGGNVFVRSAAGDDPTILLLHGFPSSSYDFRSVIARLDRRSWLTLDFLGFGLSDKPRRHNYSLLEQADIVQQVVAELPGLGHYPQIEDPDAFTDAAVRLLSG